MQKDKRNRASNYHVIANQCAHWCGNPFLFVAFTTTNCGMGMRIAPQEHFLALRAQGATSGLRPSSQ